MFKFWREQNKRLTIELLVVFVKVCVVILFNIGHYAFDLYDSFFSDMTFGIPFLSL